MAQICRRALDELDVPVAHHYVGTTGVVAAGVDDVEAISLPTPPRTYCSRTGNCPTCTPPGSLAALIVLATWSCLGPPSPNITLVGVEAVPHRGRGERRAAGPRFGRRRRRTRGGPWRRDRHPDVRVGLRRGEIHARGMVYGDRTYRAKPGPRSQATVSRCRR